MYRGYVQYYKRASNLAWFGHLHWAMYWSLLRTLARTHKTTACAMRRKYAASHMTREGVVKRVLKATKPRSNGGLDYEAVFGDVSLKTDRFAPIQDGPLQRHYISTRSELVARLLANRCEVCGSDVEGGRLDGAYYDLLASESRLASFLAIAKGDVDHRHWFQLGRPMARVGLGPGLLSWGGSMFEYLMPMLFLRHDPGTLLGRGCQVATRRQIAYGRRKRGC